MCLLSPLSFALLNAISSTLNISSPERKSDAEFQKILDTFVGDKETVLTGNLPDLLVGYEADHNTKILDEADFGGVRSLCDQYPDLELGPTDLFAFLQAVLNRDTSSRSDSPPSPSPIPHSTSMPPSSFKAAQATPDQPISRRRRHSDRIKSPSDSSSSSSGDEADVRPRGHRQTSAPPRTFPSSSNAAPAPPNGWQPIRKKTLSDPNRSDGSVNSPLSSRVRAAPPSAYGGFARPSPASRRRRGSSGGPDQYDDDRKSPEPNNMPRSVSSASMATTSPPAWQARYDSRPTSPSSQADEVDNTSFHSRAKSPGTEGDDEPDHAEPNTFIPAGQHEDEEDIYEELDEVDMDIMGQGVRSDTLNPRLSRISTESTNSLRTSHDTVARLRKENTELLRKLKETEKTLAVQGAENERLYEDLQARLEEAQSEIAQRRKDEKDMKGKDRAQLIQISGFEADIMSLQRSLENAKSNHASMQKMYNAQCDEAQRLRDMLRDRDEEIRTLEDSLQGQAADEEKFNREVHALESEVKRLETDLSVARQAESHLDVQKQENLALKETIDRMRFDLDEARAQAANAAGSSGHRAQASGSSGGGTLSRNLGDELSRRLMDAQKLQEESDEDEVVETVVTTQRTRKKGTRNVAQSGTTAEEPIFRIEEGIREYTDASQQTDFVAVHETQTDQPEAGPSRTRTETHEHPPAYSAEPEPINKAELISQIHPRRPGDAVESDEDVDDEYALLTNALGMRCTVIEEHIDAQKIERQKRGLPTSPRSRNRSYWSDQRKQYKSGIVNYIFYNTDNSVRDQVGKVAMCVVAAFAIGLVTGSHIYSTPTGIHARDYQLFAQMNTLAGAAGVGEGFLPMGVLGVVEQGARMIAGNGRIPT
ncbi:uncharacterized protein I206_101976 [Kwoniella pini CBS 10737]|uniref:Uncharacterized protein n=1 Tax=Kwoniella pini CBS 10737 TaxID=1296096 RepID=A0A1B9HV53_9TREE|nr:uncharacterized protein I206_06933 [Kwoniella pini CBS 10737]OCF47155.1 hypothetical protein I206_06933 [Kwoniella pini CBS 10737]